MALMAASRFTSVVYRVPLNLRGSRERGDGVLRRRRRRRFEPSLASGSRGRPVPNSASGFVRVRVRMGPLYLSAAVPRGQFLVRRPALKLSSLSVAPVFWSEARLHA